MEPLLLEVENFHSFRGKHTLTLEGIDLAVLVGPNGAGKSSLIDAMRFALFGATRSSLADVVTRGEEACLVEFTFRLGEFAYMVSRRRSNKGAGKSALSFLDLSGGDGEPEVLDGKTAAETQARIEQTLGMDDALFVATACASQGQVALFPNARPAERKELLGVILGLERFERRAAFARATTADIDARLEANASRFEDQEITAGEQAECEGMVRGLDGEIAECRTAIAAVEQQLEEAHATRTSLEQQKAQADILNARLKEVIDRSQMLAAADIEDKERCQFLEQALAGRPGLEERIADAVRAQQELEGMEEARRELQRLEAVVAAAQEKVDLWTHENEKRRADAQARVAAAMGMRDRERATLNHRIEDGRRQKEQRIQSLGRELGNAEQQAGPLAMVPCRNPDEVWEACKGCPLIDQAQVAEAALPGLRQDLQHAQDSCDWQDALEGLKGLAQYPPLVEANAALDAIVPDVPADLLEAVLDAIKAREERTSIQFDQATYDATMHRTTTLETDRAALAGLDAKQGELTALGDMMTERKGQRGVVAQRQDALEAERKALPSHADIEGQLNALGVLEETIERSEAGHQETLRDRTEWRGRWAQRVEAAKAAAEKAEALRDEMEADRDRRRIQVLLGDPRRGAFSKAGIPALLIERVVPELEAAANEVLGIMSDNRMALELRSQREAQDGKSVTETLDIIVYDQHGPRPYGTFSGSEEMRVALALRIALARLLASRAGTRCELLVLDETAAPLDVEGRDLLVEALQRVAPRFATILVATHIEDLKTRFPHRIEVSRDVDGSHLEVLQG